ncbi:flagellar protein FliT [Oceanobacillus alkalisoli]|uniref:flagellar protein FliT n=1 Tax=Oceanobacillus alkalisoli TaxID=2925113 RepID=UPI001F11F86B|nr:flagellar protein FliT [Oceanobacillus alkalisoli]MCF3943448.1 flagellar protein FliT [Oceanobacillus alkalisoli]
MEALEKVYELTKKLIMLLEQPVTSKNRDDVIQQLNGLIEERGKCMEQLSPPYSEDEMKLGNEIAQLNPKIQMKMEMLFTDLKTEMKQMKQQKKSQQSYTNPYKNFSTSDGTFLDRKN